MHGFVAFKSSSDPLLLNNFFYVKSTLYLVKLSSLFMHIDRFLSYISGDVSTDDPLSDLSELNDSFPALLPLIYKGVSFKIILFNLANITGGLIFDVEWTTLN